MKVPERAHVPHAFLGNFFRIFLLNYKTVDVLFGASCPTKPANLTCIFLEPA